jgi:hypothetical protein
MRRFLGFSALLTLALAVVSGCARTVSDIDKLQPGAPVTVSMKDGSTVTGRVVQVKPDAVVVDPAEGGEWKTVARDQIASVAPQAAAAAPAPAAAPTPEAAAPPPAPATEAAPAPAPAAPAPRSTAPRPAAPATAKTMPSTPTPAAPAPAPTFREVTIPEGTLLHLRLDTPLASDTSHVEDAVRASVAKPVLIDEVEAIPEGSVLSGVVTNAKPAGKVKGRAELGFRFNTLSAHNDRYTVQTQGVATQAESTTKKDAIKIGAPAAGGAIIGGILGGKKGAAIGGAIGGGAGTAVVITTTGEEVRMARGKELTVKLLSPLTVRVPTNR